MSVAALSVFKDMLICPYVYPYICLIPISFLAIHDMLGVYFMWDL